MKNSAKYLLDSSHIRQNRGEASARYAVVTLQKKLTMFLYYSPCRTISVTKFQAPYVKMYESIKARMCFSSFTSFNPLLPPPTLTPATLMIEREIYTHYQCFLTKNPTKEF